MLCLRSMVIEVYPLAKSHGSLCKSPLNFRNQAPYLQSERRQGEYRAFADIGSERCQLVPGPCVEVPRKELRFLLRCSGGRVQTH